MKDNVTPQGKWSFDEEVTAAFDDMLQRSIPQYEVMRNTCTTVASWFRKPATDIVDIGCSRGEAMAPLIDRFGAGNWFIGLEASDPMLAAVRERFQRYIAANVVTIRQHDLRRDAYPTVNASVTLSVLTLQFVPIEYRQALVRDIYRTTVPGGAFVLVEKVLGGEAELDRLLVESYYGLKTEHGYSQDQIERKRLSLEGVLVPVTARWNEDLLRAAGFARIECFWRWMNFAAWVAVKDSR